jgi:hypothetical protein
MHLSQVICLVYGKERVLGQSVYVYGEVSLRDWHEACEGDD